jgi:hypothetical protein
VSMEYSYLENIALCLSGRMEVGKSIVEAVIQL